MTWLGAYGMVAEKAHRRGVAGGIQHGGEVLATDHAVVVRPFAAMLVEVLACPSRCAEMNMSTNCSTKCLI